MCFLYENSLLDKVKRMKDSDVSSQACNRNILPSSTVQLNLFRYRGSKSKKEGKTVENAQI